VELNYKNNFCQRDFKSRGTVDCKSNSKSNGNAKIAVRLFGSLNDPRDIEIRYNVKTQFHGKNLTLNHTLILNWGLILVMVIAEYSLFG